MRMSRRNSREGKARRRAEREHRQRSVTSGQGPRPVEVPGIPAVPAVPAALRPLGSRPRNSDERASGLRSDADGGLIAVELDEADLDTDEGLENADPGDFGGLDPDD